MRALRFSALGELVDDNGEVIPTEELSTDQLAELRARLKQLSQVQSVARHVIDAEIIRRVDAAIDAGEAPEQYTFETERFKVSVTSRRGAMRTDETALRASLLKQANTLGIMPLRVERLFTPAGYKRNEQYWKQFVAEVPEAERVRAEHTMPSTRSVTKVDLLPHVRPLSSDRFTEVAEVAP